MNSVRKKELSLYFFVIFLGIISFYFDAIIVKYISHLRINFLDSFFLGLTVLSSEIIIFFFLTSLFLWKEHKRKWIFPLWFTLFMSAAIAFILKITVQRQRPYQLMIVSTLDVLKEHSHFIWDFSFPSFQSMLAFSAIPILSKEFPKFKYVWIIFAVLIAFSRVYFGVHFMSDVIAGGLIGYIIGKTIINYEEETNLGEKLYGKIFGKIN